MRDSDDFSRLGVADFAPSDCRVHGLVSNEAAGVQFLRFWVQVVWPAGADESIWMNGFEHERCEVVEVRIVSYE